MAAYTTIDDPSEYFQTETYTGAGANTSVTFSGNSDLKPDWLWIKNRSAGYAHAAFDSNRNLGSAVNAPFLEPNDTSADNSNQNWWNATNNGINTDGFQFGSVSEHNLNNLGSEYVAWAWKANGGTTSTNTNGTVNSTVQANTTAGFSIVQWASDGAPDTIGHGLSQAPDWIFMKSTVSTLHWFGYSRELGPGKQHLLALDYIQSNTSVLNNTDPSSTVFYTNHSDVSSGGMIAYCFHSVQGYSKFGSYTGNGNANGPFIYLGFKPAFFLIKKTSAADGWRLFDNKRAGYNDDNYRLAPNSSDAEDTSTTYLDMLSNGVKIRGTAGSFNQSGGTYIYMAFAENPFVTSTGIPTTAR